MTRAPELSIVVPSHDAVSTLDLTLRSLLGQEIEATEVLVIDDASRDETPVVARAWARRDPRVRVIELRELLPIGEVRNLALREFRGAHLAFVDADDWVAPDYHRAMLDELRRLDVDFVKSDHTAVTGTSRTRVRAPTERPGVRVEGLADLDRLDRRTLLDYGYSTAALYRGDFARREGLDFGRDLASAEDRLFTWKAHLLARSHAVVPHAGYLYRRELRTSLTRVGDARQLGFLGCIDQTLALLEAVSAPPTLYRKAYQQALSLLLFQLDRRERLSAAAFDELGRRGRAQLEAMDHSLLAPVEQRLDPARRRTLDSLRAGELRRSRV